MADQEKLEVWLSYRFDSLVQARQDRIWKWNKAHQPAKERARLEIARLSSRLVTRDETRTPMSHPHACTTMKPGMGV
jgi:uncharacterized protein YqjF (DUF2071 family)